jgi:hypothetical protein
METSSPIDVIRSRWKAVTTVAVGLFLLQAAALLLFPKYECNATVALTRKGMTLAAYKRLEDALLDTASLKGAFKDVLPSAPVEQLQRDLSLALSPRVSGPRDEIRRAAATEVVFALRLTHQARSAERAERFVTASAVLVREGATTIIAETILDADEGRTRATQAEINRLRLAATNESLKSLEANLRQVAREFPGGQGPTGREVVNVAEGGYFYLPLSAQLVGVKARAADNEHQMRVHSWTAKTESLRADFYRQLTARLFGGRLSGDRAAVVYGVPQLAREALEAFLAQQTQGPELEHFRVEAKAFVDLIEDHHSGVAYLALPSTRFLSPVRSLAIAAILAVLLAVSGTLLATLWARTRTA